MAPARFTAITLGVANMRTAIDFYEKLGFERKFKATGDDVAFFATGGSVLALYPWHKLAADADVPDVPRPAAYRGVTLAWNCNSREEVNEALAQVIACGGRALKSAHATDYGGYAGFFADPDGHVWEVVCAPGITVDVKGRLHVPE
jgi:predicted lactoylglutathione lyase